MTQKIKPNLSAPDVVSVPCYDFSSDGKVREKRTVMIVPIVAEVEDNVLKFGYACSRAPFCHDSCCRYSKVSGKGSRRNDDNAFYDAPDE